MTGESLVEVLVLKLGNPRNKSGFGVPLDGIKLKSCIEGDGRHCDIWEKRFLIILEAQGDVLKELCPGV